MEIFHSALVSVKFWSNVEFYKDFDSGQEVMGPAYRTAAGMMLCMFFAVTFHHCALSKTFFWNLVSCQKWDYDQGGSDDPGRPVLPLQLLVQPRLHHLLPLHRPLLILVRRQLSTFIWRTLSPSVSFQLSFFLNRPNIIHLLEFHPLSPCKNIHIGRFPLFFLNQNICKFNVISPF